MKRAGEEAREAKNRVSAPLPWYSEGTEDWQGPLFTTGFTYRGPLGRRCPEATQTGQWACPSLGYRARLATLEETSPGQRSPWMPVATPQGEASASESHRKRAAMTTGWRGQEEQPPAADRLHLRPTIEVCAVFQSFALKLAQNLKRETQLGLFSCLPAPSGPRAPGRCLCPGLSPENPSSCSLGWKPRPSCRADCCDTEP